MSKSASADAKRYDGKPEGYGIWETRFASSVRGAGMSFQMYEAMRDGVRPFEDMKYVRAELSLEQVTASMGFLNPRTPSTLRSSTRKLFQTPQARGPGSSFLGDSGKERKKEEQAEREQTRSILQNAYNEHASVVYGILINTISDGVVRKLQTHGLKDPHGFVGVRLMRKLYFVGGGLGLLPTNFRKLITLRQEGDFEEPDEYVFQFSSLNTFLQEVQCALPQKIATLLFVHGVNDTYKTLKDRLHDEFRVSVPALTKIIERFRHNRESAKGDQAFKVKEEEKESDSPRGGGGGNGSGKGKGRYKKKAFVPPPANEEMICYNCNNVHGGGSFHCTRPCGACGSTSHKKRDCKDEKAKRKARQKYLAELKAFQKHKERKQNGSSETGAAAIAAPRNGIDWAATLNNSNTEYEQHQAMPAQDLAPSNTAASSTTNTTSKKPLLDSGASSHFVPKSEVRGHARVRNGSGFVQTAGKQLPITGVTDLDEMLVNVKIVPGLDRSLVSVSKQTKNTKSVICFEEEVAYSVPSNVFFRCMRKFLKKEHIIARNVDGVYEYERPKEVAYLANKIKGNGVIQLIHERFAHRNVVGILKAIQRGTIIHAGIQKLGLKGINRLIRAAKQFNCVACGMGKCPRLPARRKKTRSLQKVGRLWYADACTPVRPYVPMTRKGHTHKKETGYMLMVENQSGYIYEEGISSKADSARACYDALMPIAQALPRNENHATLREIIVDGAKEMVTEQAKKNLASIGFQIKDVSGHHANGIARVDERMRVLTETTRAMMLTKTHTGAAIPAMEHSYARTHARRLLNVLPNTTGATPYEMFWNEKPEITRFRTFYEPVFVKLYDGKERKKSERYKAAAFLGFYLGIPPGGRGHLIRVPGKSRPIIRHDCYFLGDLPESIPLRKLTTQAMHKVNRTALPEHKVTDDWYQRQEYDEEPEDPMSYSEDSVSFFSTKPGKERKIKFISEEKNSDEKHDGGNKKETKQNTGLGMPELDDVSSDDDDDESDEAKIQNNSENEDSKKEWDVEDILKHRDGKNGREFLIDWTGDWNPTWEPERNLKCDKKLKAYWDTAQAAETFISKAPRGINQAMSKQHRKTWMPYINKEVNNFVKHEAWEPARATGKERVMRTVWQFANKLNSDGTLDKRKARMCLDGRAQEDKIDYDKTYAPVVPQSVMRLALSLGVLSSMKTRQFDFDGAFLNAPLDKPLYIKPPPGYQMPAGCDLLRLKKAMYGAKQSAHLWYQMLRTELLKRGFVECPSAKCLFVRKEADGEPTIIFVHVDDGVILHNNDNSLDQLLTEMNKTLPLTKDKLNWYLGLKVDKLNDGLRISVPSYIEQIAERFHLEDANPKRTPVSPGTAFMKNKEEKHKCPYQEAIGALTWASVNCRPDITYGVAKLSKHNGNPSKAHWNAVKRIIAYLLSTKEKGLWYEKPEKKMGLMEVLRTASLRICCDSDYAGEIEGRASTTGFLIYLNNHLIDWGSYTQPVVAQSTCEAEYIAANRGAKRGRYLRKVLNEIMAIATFGRNYMEHLVKIKPEKDQSTLFVKENFKNQILQDLKIKDTVKVDNASAVKVASTGNFQQRLKHIEVRFYYLAQEIEKRRLNIEHIPGFSNPSDLLTKSVKTATFLRLINKLVS